MLHTPYTTYMLVHLSTGHPGTRGRQVRPARLEVLLPTDLFRVTFSPQHQLQSLSPNCQRLSPPHRDTPWAGSWTTVARPACQPQAEGSTNLKISHFIVSFKKRKSISEAEVMLPCSWSQLLICVFAKDDTGGGATVEHPLQSVQ